MGARLFILVAIAVAAAVTVPKLAPGVLANLVTSRPADPADPVGDATPAPAAAPERDAAARPSQSLNTRRMILEADPRGHFLVDASVNGRKVAAMVDTGASTVALGAETARRLGINPPKSAYTVPVSTANGIVEAANVTLSEVRVGGIRVRNVAALVVPDGLLEVNLLGMSFLSRLSKFELSGPRLVLLQ